MGNCNYCSCIDEKSGQPHHEMRGSVDMMARPTSTIGSGRDAHSMQNPVGEGRKSQLPPSHSQSRMALQRQQLSSINNWYVGLTLQEKHRVQRSLIQIQSAWRGYIVRKRFKMIKQIFLNGIEGGYFDSSIDESALL